MLIHADCLNALRHLPDNSVDSVVTDPPYGLGFMGKAWDTFDKSQFGIAGNEGENDLKVKKNFNVLPRYKSDGLQDFVFAWASECLRVLKPGGYLLSFAGTRTQHRIACGIEDAGFEIRDMIAWVYGSGFPKSLNVGNGYGTALKPAHEPITVARKPIEGTVAANVLKWGTGAIDIDGCRVGTKDTLSFGSRQIGDGVKYGKCSPTTDGIQNPQGRFPANLIHDGSDEVLELFPETKSGKMKQHIEGGNFNVFSKQYPRDVETIGDSGSAARFFYCAKASKAERNAGLEDMQPVRESDRVRDDGVGGDNPRNRSNTAKQNHHPTVKPIALMRYLIKLVTPPNGTVLDPFLGSGTTAIAAVLEGREWIGIEREAEYCDIARARIAAAESQQLEMAL